MLPGRLWVYSCLIWGTHLLLLLTLHTAPTRSLPADDAALEECAKSRTAADFVVCLNRTMPNTAPVPIKHVFETTEGFACKGQCGTQTLACSCRPMCVPAGSCCDDFLQECPEEVQRLNGDLQWLRHVNMTCTHFKVYIVNSCPVPGSTLDKLLRAASNPSAQPSSTQPPDTFSASYDGTFETNTDREVDIMPTDEPARNRSLSMSDKGDNGGSVDCNYTSIRNKSSNMASSTVSSMATSTESRTRSSTRSRTTSSPRSSTGSSTEGSTGSSTGSGTGSSSESSATITSGTHFKRLTTVNTKDERGRFSNGKELNVGRTRDFQGGDPLLGNRGSFRKPHNTDESILSEGDEFQTKISFDFKQAYANAPVTDVKTGLVFANSSVFDCYSSVTGEKIYWEYDLDPIGEELLNLTMSELLKHFTSEIRLARPRYAAPLDATPLHERCIYRARDQCPEKSVLGPGCARSTGYVLHFRRGIIYRNPFCFACNENNTSFIYYVDPLLLGVHRGYSSEFKITMLPEWNRVRFIASFNPLREYFLAPLWKEITCEESDAPRMTSIGNDVIYPNGSQACRILSCRAGVLKYGKCYVETIFVIKRLHIPGKSNIGDFNNIPKCLMIFNKEISEASVSVIPVDKTPDGPVYQLNIYLFGYRDFALDLKLLEFVLNIVWENVGHPGMPPADFCVLNLGKHVIVPGGRVRSFCLDQRQFRSTDRCTAGCWATTGLIQFIATALGFQFL